MSSRLVGLILAAAIAAAVIWLARNPGAPTAPPAAAPPSEPRPTSVPVPDADENAPAVTSTDLLRGPWAIAPLPGSLRDLDAVWDDRSAPLRAAMGTYGAPSGTPVHLLVHGPLDAPRMELAVPIGGPEGEKRAIEDGLEVRTYEGGDAFAAELSGGTLRGTLRRLDDQLRLAARSDGSPQDGFIAYGISRTGDTYLVQARLSLMTD